MVPAATSWVIRVTYEMEISKPQKLQLTPLDARDIIMIRQQIIPLRKDFFQNLLKRFK